MRAKTYGETCTYELFVSKLLSYFLYYFNKIAASTQMYWYQSNGNCLNFMFLYVLHVENNFPVQNSGITLDKKIEKLTIITESFRKIYPKHAINMFLFQNNIKLCFCLPCDHYIQYGTMKRQRPICVGSFQQNITSGNLTKTYSKPYIFLKIKVRTLFFWYSFY